MKTIEIKNIYIVKKIVYLIILYYEFIVLNLKIYQYVITINNKVEFIKNHYTLIMSNKKPNQ